MQQKFSRSFNADALFTELVSERLDRLQSRMPGLLQVRPSTNGDAIFDLMAKVSPMLRRPVHFRVYASKLETAVGADMRLVFAAPPQHGKTEVTLHALAWICQTYPTRRHAYITYNLQRARRVAKKFRNYLRRLNIRVGGTLDCMELPGGGQVLFTSIDGGITGDPVDGVAIIDDPIKNRKEADSATRREDVLESYRDNIETRVHPGASVVVLATRWHPQDLSGTLIEEGWEYINLPAIAEGDSDANGRQPGEPLFPEMWPVEALAKKRKTAGELTWSALYQGRPRPRGGHIFHEANYYTALPTVYRGAFGVDLAYSLKSSADMSICLELWREDRGFAPTGERELPLFYVVNVDRERQEAPDFAKLLKRRHQAKKFPMLWRASGVEAGSADFIKRMGVPLAVQAPRGDKVVSSTEVAAAWNDGRVLVPDREKFPLCESWIDAFLDIIADFTGSGKEHDDDVDALGNAHALLLGNDTGGKKREEKPKKPKRETARDMVGFAPATWSPLGRIPRQRPSLSLLRSPAARRARGLGGGARAPLGCVGCSSPDGGRSESGRSSRARPSRSGAPGRGQGLRRSDGLTWSRLPSDRCTTTYYATDPAGSELGHVAKLAPSHESRHRGPHLDHDF